MLTNRVSGESGIRTHGALLRAQPISSRFRSTGLWHLSKCPCYSLTVRYVRESMLRPQVSHGTSAYGPGPALAEGKGIEPSGLHPATAFKTARPHGHYLPFAGFDGRLPPPVFLGTSQTLPHPPRKDRDSNPGGCYPYPLSRRAPSATRPSFQRGRCRIRTCGSVTSTDFPDQRLKPLGQPTSPDTSRP